MNNSENENPRECFHTMTPHEISNINPRRSTVPHFSMLPMSSRAGHAPLAPVACHSSTAVGVLPLLQLA